MSESVDLRTTSMSITESKLVSQGCHGFVLTIGGLLRRLPDDDVALPFTCTFSEAKSGQGPTRTSASLEFDCGLSSSSSSSSPSSSSSSSSSSLTYNRLILSQHLPPQTSVHGLGVQYSSINHAGKTVPILVSEQGIGRGLEPITAFLNEFASGAGGNDFTTYCPVPSFVTSKGFGLSLSNYEVSVFDVGDTVQGVLQAEVWSNYTSGYIHSFLSPLDYLFSRTAVTGRMQPLPTWTQVGAIVGLEGGTSSVVTIVDSLSLSGVPIAAVWLQDWVGNHRSYDGVRLKWDWTGVDYDLYPTWDSMVSTWKANGTRTLTYINPYFQSNVKDGWANTHPGVLYEEGEKNGYFIKDKSGATYAFKSGSIKFGVLDVTNPYARTWMKNIIKNNVVLGGGASGWMADFGEAIPFDAVAFDGTPPDRLHNQYGALWSALNVEACEELGMLDDLVPFGRSGYTESPGMARLFWVGDQLVTFDGKDGLQTVPRAYQSGGLAGHALAHSDIGGYTIVDYPLARYHRGAELLKRWSEMEAFAGSMFRTHLGSTISDEDAQVWDSDESREHFARCAKLFGFLADYRLALMEEAKDFGWPLVRSLFLHYPSDTNAWDEDVIAKEFLLGEDFLVAPVMEEGKTEVNVYFPGGTAQVWVNLWTGEKYGGGSIKDVKGPIGQPPVFFKDGSKWGLQLQEDIKQL